MKLSKLIKQNDCTTETEFFDYMVATYVNGNKADCKMLFSKMKIADKKHFVTYIRHANQNMYDLFIDLI